METKEAICWSAFTSEMTELNELTLVIAGGVILVVKNRNDVGAWLSANWLIPIWFSVDFFYSEENYSSAAHAL